MNFRIIFIFVIVLFNDFYGKLFIEKLMYWSIYLVWVNKFGCKERVCYGVNIWLRSMYLVFFGEKIKREIINYDISEKKV